MSGKIIVENEQFLGFCANDMKQAYWKRNKTVSLWILMGQVLHFNKIQKFDKKSIHAIFLYLSKNGLISTNYHMLSVNNS